MSKERVEMAKTAGIKLPTPLPLFESPPNKKAAVNWVSAHHRFPEIQKIAQKIVDNINYISFKKFYDRLQQTILDFNDQIKDTPYILWVAANDVYDSGCSDRWVAGLALEQMGLTLPRTIVNTSNLSSYLSENPHVKTVLLLDDASYSGSHIKDEITGSQIVQHLTQGIQLFFGIPFMTSHAEKLFLSYENTSLLKHEQIPMLEELLSTEEITSLKKYGFMFGMQTLTYFDHTYPDVYSIIPNLGQGDHLLSLYISAAMQRLGYTLPWEQPSSSAMQPEEWEKHVATALPRTIPPIVPTIIRPYRVEKAALIDALEKGTLGRKNQVPPPPELEKLFSVSSPQDHKYQDYKGSKDRFFLPSDIDSTTQLKKEKRCLFPCPIL